MLFSDIFLIALGLAMDATAVSLGVGTAGQADGPRPIFRLSFHFGLFQALMPVLGWFAGTTVAGFVNSVAPWLAFILLAFVGVRMVRSGLNKDCEACPPNASRGATLILLCVATSIDAFAVGLSMAMLHVNVFYPSAVIGVVTALLSLAGLLLGSRLGTRFGKRMEIVGGLLLNGIGLRVLLTSLL